MKVETNTRKLIALLLLGLSGAALVAQPGTAELREPKAVEVVTPVVPAEFARYKVGGEVEVLFRIGEDGRPRDVEVVAASHTEYAESVVNALRKWRFEHENGGDVLYRLPVLFN